ncbi:MAG: hypothetical protein MHMPM18_004730 [Marteilia pararefringens]
MDKRLLDEHSRFKQRASTSLAFVNETLAKKDKRSDETNLASNLHRDATIQFGDQNATDSAANQYFSRNHGDKSRFGLLASIIQFLLVILRSFLESFWIFCQKL